MRILISLSAKVEFVKGDRVAFRAAKDEWYVGTVTSVRSGNVGILFDDGLKGEPAKPTARSWKKLAPVKKIKRPLSDAAVAKLPLVESVATPKRAPKAALVKKSTPRVIAAPTATKAPVKLAKHAEYAAGRITAEEKHLLAVLGMHSEYAHATDDHKRHGPVAKIKYLDLIYTKANSLFFHNRMTRPVLYLMKDMGTSFRGRGYWQPSRRKIGISPRLFLSNEEQVLTTLVHEMCHQAVSEIDRVPTDNHGPHWNDWMRKCGLTPSRYSQYDNETYMTEGERAAHQKKLANREVAKETAVKEGMRRMYPRSLEPAQYHDADSNKWIKGLIVGPNDQAGKRWGVVVDPYSRSWKVIPSDWFYELPPAEHAKYMDGTYMKAAQAINDYKNQKDQKRQERSGFRKIARGLYGI